MGDQHLSELCRKTEVEPILHRLQHLVSVAPEDVTANEEGAEDGAPTSSSSSPSSSPYLHGVWGYRDGDGRTAFHWAVALKNYELANTLMNAPYNAPVLTEDHDGVTPFATACMVGAPEPFIVAVLDRSIDAYPAFAKWKAAHAAVTEQQQQQVSELRDATGTGHDHDAPGNTTAAPSGEKSTAGGAGAQDANVTTVTPPATDSNGATNEATGAVTDATSAPPPPPPPSSPAELLLNTEDSLGNTPLLSAVSRGNFRVVKLLVQRGSNLWHQNHRGQSALHRAVSRGNTDVVELLVSTSEQQNGANKVNHRRWMNLQDYRGDSALFYASMENNEELGRYLLRHGADRDQRNKEGKQFWEV